MYWFLTPVDLMIVPRQAIFFPRIITKLYRRKCDPHADVLCLISHAVEESRGHLLIQCLLARSIWERIGRATGMNSNFDSLEGMWNAGRRLFTKGDRSPKA
ncbi:hypothetical protein QJS10_CPA05g01777 [Acorus calamus]|uniref:Reverse transcriptase zinc-binding domain-containing protein n=1 Tax=Acorus calamus TaxID=4465 RepID=A0AAV9EWV1_ACOCL|nr:hypothetical protein QJS10_CPA05g01844 [Acorus calamus]KAK1316887.1 hypothetical protein QJS10_CPA05g01777 [Acorus calamus]